MYWLNSLWNFIWSSASLGTIIGSCAAAVAIFLPKPFDFITDLRKWAIVVAVIAFSFTAVAGKFYNDGLRVKQAQWDAALAKQIGIGAKARSDAERTVDDAGSSGLPNDKYDRDNP